MNIPDVLYLHMLTSMFVEVPDFSAMTFSDKRINDTDIAYRREPEWTRVEDGLPKEGAAVWIRLEIMRRPVIIEADYDYGVWQPGEYENVTHWMPRQERPEPPREE